MIVYKVHGERVAEISHRGAPLESERDATDLIAEALSSDAAFVAIPAARISFNSARARQGISFKNS